MTNPALPKLDAQLVQNFFAAGQRGYFAAGRSDGFNDQTAIVLGTSAIGAPPTGQALWTTIDVSTPAKPNVLGQTMIPQASIAINLALQGNLALIAGNTGGVSESRGGRSDHEYRVVSVHRQSDAAPGRLHQSAEPGDSGHSCHALSGHQRYPMISLGGGFFAVTIRAPADRFGGPDDARDRGCAESDEPWLFIRNTESTGCRECSCERYLYTVSNGGSRFIR